MSYCRKKNLIYVHGKLQNYLTYTKCYIKMSTPCSVSLIFHRFSTFSYQLIKTHDTQDFVVRLVANIYSYLIINLS